MWKMECVSTPRVTPRFLLTEILISFCGRVFGGLRSPQKWPSSGKIHTEDNPWKRYICIVKWCCMCKNTGDSKINGSFAAILHIIYGHWCFACSDSIGLRQRQGGIKFAGLLEKGIWQTSQCWLMGGNASYGLFGERYLHTFEGIKHSPLELKLFLVRSTYDWTTA